MYTLVLIKPDAIQRCLVGEIISRIERKGLTIREMDMTVPHVQTVKRHYIEHCHQPFFDDMVETLANKPVISLLVEGINAVHVVRRLIGETSYCRDCSPGTIRGDFGVSSRYTLVHGSDSIESAERERALWFPSGPRPYRLDRDDWTKTSMDRDEEETLLALDAEAKQL